MVWKGSRFASATVGWGALGVAAAKRGAGAAGIRGLGSEASWGCIPTGLEFRGISSVSSAPQAPSPSRGGCLLGPTPSTIHVPGPPGPESPTSDKSLAGTASAALGGGGGGDDGAGTAGDGNAASGAALNESEVCKKPQRRSASSNRVDGKHVTCCKKIRTKNVLKNGAARAMHQNYKSYAYYSPWKLLHPALSRA